MLLINQKKLISEISPKLHTFKKHKDLYLIDIVDDYHCFKEYSELRINRNAIVYHKSLNRIVVNCLYKDKKGNLFIKAKGKKLLLDEFKYLEDNPTEGVILSPRQREYARLTQSTPSVFMQSVLGMKVVK